MNTSVILDGEHRVSALRELGYSKIPVIFVNYKSQDILVESWRIDEHLTKSIVIAAGLSGRKLPPKTSRHMINFRGRLKHISILGTTVKIPLRALK